ncbi:MAG: hypothetical protein KF821_02010 [Anaerolineales bacterium]|nr:hypothetical protein [Anaerolineales bacterium]
MAAFNFSVGKGFSAVAKDAISLQANASSHVAGQAFVCAFSACAPDEAFKSSQKECWSAAREQKMLHINLPDVLEVAHPNLAFTYSNALMALV